jgi:hypothetical protein
MKNKVIVIILISIIYFMFIFNHCDTMSYHTFKLCPVLGIDDAQVCCGDLSCTDKCDHAWIRINGINIETTTFNLIKSPYCDYDNPYFMSDNMTEIRTELLIT